MKGLNPRTDIALLILRVGIGLIMMYYGSQKLMGAFGGPGPKATIDFLQTAFGIPMPLAICAMCAEFFGGLGLIIGLLTPLSGGSVAVTMAVATVENWKSPGVVDGALHGKNADASQMFFSLSLLLSALALALLGAGKHSLDAKLFIRKARR